MRFSTHIVALGVLACGLPSWAQDKAQASPPSGDSYSEHLKELASEQNASKPASKAKSPEASKDLLRRRESYSKHLEKLSGGEDASKTHSDTESSETYRDHLRDLAQGHDSGSAKTNATSGLSSEDAGGAEGRDRESRAEQVTVSNRASSSQSPAKAVTNSDTMERVSVTRTEKDEGVQPVGITSQAIPAGNCSDAYCEQLRRVAEGQSEQPYVSRSDNGRTLTTERNFVKNLAFDQVHIWQSPFKMRDSDATWAVPFGIITGSLVATDRDVSKQLAKPSRVDTSKQISNLGLYSFIGAGAGFYGLGLISHDDHKRETGLLSGEAFINASLVAEALKYAFGRERPFEGDHFGHIGRGGSSFPSEHAIGSWAVATVFAHEYPNPFMQIAAYGLASAVSVSRITAGQHFPSDVFVGSTFGYLIGRKIYKDHHNSELGGSDYGTFVASERGPTKSIGSAYVPLDSWAYPVIEKLAGLGYVRSAFLDMRPWSRTECARIVREADESGANDDPVAGPLLSSLKQEFALELGSEFEGSRNRSAQLESAYGRVTGIAGPPLNDSFHFGQAIINDYGRPYQRGISTETGFSGFAMSGPVAVYFRGEFQTAPSAAGYPLNVRQAIASIDAFPGNASLPVLPDEAINATQRFRVLEAYASINMGGYQLSFGKQSLWWGPGEGAAMLFSNNAEPLPMVRFTNVSPVQLPGIAHLLGAIRFESFLGQVDGQRFVGLGLNSENIVSGPNLSKLVSQPFINGQKFTFKPTPNLEFSISRTAIIGGTGLPLTFTSFGHSFFDLGSGSADRTGDRRSGVDLTYKIPKLRNRLLFYADAFTDDDVSPLNYPRRAPMSAGIYVPQLPGVPQMDLRVEGGYTDIPDQDLRGFFYSNRHYLSGYTNDGNLLGNWMGRDGRGVQAWSTYWFSPRTKLQLSYRYQGINDGYLQGGGLLNDVGIRAVENLGNSVDFSQSLQFERWNYPVLAGTAQNNVVTTLQITYRPSSWRVKPVIKMQH
ncbi:MAG: capsule assembly Wzi family protein [Terriglobales bacterium]